jgi:uncharacterized membrane-anchored protein
VRGSSSDVLAFWIAYILTRPLGASFADWMGEPPVKGGLGWGDGTVAIALFVLIIATVAYLAITKRDVQRESPQRFDGEDYALRVG